MYIQCLMNESTEVQQHVKSLHNVKYALYNKNLG